MFLHSDAVHRRAVFLFAMRCCSQEEEEWWYVCYREYICSNSYNLWFICFKDRSYYTAQALELRTTLLCQLAKYWVIGVCQNNLPPAFDSFILNGTASSLVKFCLKHYLLSFFFIYLVWVCMLVEDGGVS